MKRIMLFGIGSLLLGFSAGWIAPAQEILNRNSGRTPVATEQRGASTGPSCTRMPSGMVSWWPMDCSLADIVDGNNPSSTSGVSRVPGKVSSGATFSSGAFIELAHSANLANPQFTLDAWVRPDGRGPNDDQWGNVIITKNKSGSDVSAGLLWRATDNRFVFLFGPISTERIFSTAAFPPGQFYHVAATYDGTTFKLYVNGQPQGQFVKTKTVSYTPSIPWAIGATAAIFRNAGFARTWNGVIDEVEVFNRALSLSEIQAIFNAGSAGKCKPFA